MRQITEVVKHLIIINVLFFIGSAILTNNGIFDGIKYLSLYYPESPSFRPYQIVTHFFMHANFSHIAFNMFALYMFGPPVEALLKEKRFLFFYFFSALGAVALHFVVVYLRVQQIIPEINPQSFELVMREGANVIAQGKNYTQPILGELNALINTPMLGASGAITGVVLAFGMKFPNAELMLIFFPVPIKAKYLIPIILGIDLFLGISQFSWDNVAHFAHLGGALFGFLLILYWQKFDSDFRIR